MVGQRHRTRPPMKHRPEPPVRNTGRAQKTAARREAILAAALDEFSARGFAATRLEDVARRAGVAKGTIYLHFADKEALFQELVRTMLGPLVASLDQLRTTDLPIRAVLERFADLFVIGIYGTRRRDVAHREVVERGMAAMSALLERAIARGEIPHTALARFPQLVAAPGLIAIIWRVLFDRFAHLDAAGMMRAHIDILLGSRSTS
jgi:AcrR family transcriptional regulator